MWENYFDVKINQNDFFWNCVIENENLYPNFIEFYRIWNEVEWFVGNIIKKLWKNWKSRMKVCKILSRNHEKLEKKTKKI